jgi:hypothetical protein
MLQKGAYLVGDIIPIMIFSRVVFPAPFSPTIHILDSEFAPMLTPLKIVRSVDGYRKPTSSSVSTGGLRTSTSGNLRTTSVSFSTGLSSGLRKMKYSYGNLKSSIIKNLQLLEHFDF